MIRLNWKRYENFFDLWAERLDEAKLMYIIGETDHCYIGNVGGKGGMNGLGQRYQKSYVQRARAIYGEKAPRSQPAFAASLEHLSPPEIIPLERQLQEIFIEKIGRSKALFTPRGEVPNYKLVHSGDVPSFLK